MLWAVIADTHMPRGTRRLPNECVERLRAADLVLHAGDFVEPSVLADLERLGPPVAAVHGNVDAPPLRRTLPVQRIVEGSGVRVGLVHDPGPAHGRLARLRRRFPGVDAVVFGHSHMPLRERAGDGFQIFNPGSPTERRRAPAHTMGEGEVRDGTVRLALITLT